MKDKVNSIKKLVLGVFAVVLAICVVSSIFITVDFPSKENDLLLYRLSCFLLLGILEIGLLLEMNLFHLRKKIPLIKSTNIFKHILFWFVTVIIASVFFFIPYNMISDDFINQLNKNDNVSEDMQTTELSTEITELGNIQTNMFETKEHSTSDIHSTTGDTNISVSEKEKLTWRLLSKDADRYKLVLTLLGEHFNKGVYETEDFSDLSLDEKQLVKELFGYTNKNNMLPVDFTETFTAFCVGEEFEDMILESYDNPFYNALSKSFVISWKSDNTYYIDIRESTVETQKPIDGYISEESPLTYVYDENESIVGNCTVKLKKIEIVNKLHKSYAGNSSYSKFIRVQATVTNNSSQETYFTSRKNGQFFIGKYHGNEGDTNIGWNDNYKWKIDSDIKSDVEWTLEPNETRDICLTGVFTDSERLKYNDAPKIDLYFVNEGKTLTLTIN